MTELNPEQLNSQRKCLIPGGAGDLCQLPQGHDGWHYALVGAGAAAWGTSYPRWDGRLGRWVQPDEPEYEAGIERLRGVVHGR